MRGAISTHSRAKAAGAGRLLIEIRRVISTHSRAKAAGHHAVPQQAVQYHFNSQPREGGWSLIQIPDVVPSGFQLTAARRRLVKSLAAALRVQEFQLTAARRRLAYRL